MYGLFVFLKRWSVKTLIRWGCLSISMRSVSKKTMRMYRVITVGVKKLKRKQQIQKTWKSYAWSVQKDWHINKTVLYTSNEYVLNQSKRWSHSPINSQALLRHLHAGCRNEIEINLDRDRKGEPFLYIIHIFITLFLYFYLYLYMYLDI